MEAQLCKLCAQHCKGPVSQALDLVTAAAAPPSLTAHCSHQATSANTTVGHVLLQPAPPFTQHCGQQTTSHIVGHCSHHSTPLAALHFYHASVHHPRSAGCTNPVSDPVNTQTRIVGSQACTNVLCTEETPYKEPYTRQCMHTQHVVHQQCHHR